MKYLCTEKQSGNLPSLITGLFAHFKLSSYLPGQSSSLITG